MLKRKKLGYLDFFKSDFRSAKMSVGIFRPNWAGNNEQIFRRVIIIVSLR